MDKRSCRSAGYQHVLLEISCSNDMMTAFTNEDSIGNRLCPFSYDETVLELEDKLKEEFWRLVEKLTPRQKEVIRLYADGLTQMEIAKKLGVNQSSITKSIHGNVDYKKGRKVYGGSSKRLKKIIDVDPKIKEILDKISELRALKL